MSNFREIKINNSKNAAIIEGKWSKPGAKFYDTLMNSFYCNGKIPADSKALDQAIKDGKYIQWHDYLKEAYLVAPVTNIKNSPYGRTPFTNSGCKYPHHVIKNGQLVVSVPGLRAAYSRACQQGVMTGSVKQHFDRHVKELGLEETFKNFNESYDILNEDVEHQEFDNETDRDEPYVPVFGISKSYSAEKLRNDGTPKTSSEKLSVWMDKVIHKATLGDNYSHSLISFDISLEEMYSYEGLGFVTDNIMTKDSWLGTKSVYICVMFVKKSDRDRMKKYVENLRDHPEQTSYAFPNLFSSFFSNPTKVDKRFICSSFVGYIMQYSDPKNVRRDYSRTRPEDVTILPRTFYVANIIDRNDFIRRKNEIKMRVKAIFDEYKEDIDEYNNMLPKLMLKDTFGSLKTIDKIIDSIIGKFVKK